MFRKLLLKNQGIVNSSKNIIRCRRTTATSAQKHDDMTVCMRPNPVQHAVAMLTDIEGTNKVRKEVMNQKLNDFEKLIVEAKLSINDCIEGTEDDMLDDDKETAKDAVREAINLFGDISYDIQNSFDKGDLDQTHTDLIQNLSMQLDQLKSELESALGETKRANFLLDNIRDKIMQLWRN